MATKNKILIVEDDAIIGNHLQRLLGSLGYIAYGPFSNGEKAMIELDELDPDIILMDINLEGPWDGIETANQIHKIRSIPIIYITAFADDETLKRAGVTDPYGYLLKPFDERILQITIETSLSKYNLQQEIVRSEAKFRTVVEKLSEGIGILDTSHNITFSNPALADILGLPEEQLTGKSLKSFLSRDDWNDFQKRSKRLNENSFELTVIKPNRENRLTLCSISPWLSSGLESSGTYFVLRDITETKLIQEREKEQRVLAETLIEIAASINKSLNLDEVFDLILENIGKVVPHQSSNIMEITENRVRIKSTRGYEKYRLKEEIERLEFNLSEVTSFCEAAQTGKIIIENDTHASKAWKPLTSIQFIRSSILAPIMIKGRAVGFINLDNDEPNQFDANDAKMLSAVADQAAIAIENAHLYKQMQVWAVTDELTGVWNRRGIIDMGQKELNRSIRYAHPLAILWVDFDNFKDVNDGYGHSMGDQILKEQVRKWKDSLRDIDLVGRLGGDEFVIILPETDLQGGMEAAERIRKKIISTSREFEKNISTLTASIGVVAVGPGIKEFSQLLSLADTAMYRAKQLGKNRVSS